MTSEARQSIHEKLDAAEARLVGAESSAGESMDLHLVIHLLFRDFHNLKSALSMEGADLSAELIHQAEAPDLSRRLKAFLGECLDQGQDSTRELGFPLEPAEAQALRKAVSAGLVPYILEKLAGESLDLKGAESLPVFDAVAEAGPLIARRLVGVKGSGAILTIVFASEKSPEDLSFILFDPFHPLNGSRKAEPPVSSAADRKKLKRLLIVDDEAIALMLLQRFLSPYGRIDTAENGSEALDKFTGALKGKDPYDVVFLDILIPGIPGNVVLEEIRKREKDSGSSAGDGARIVMASSLSDYASISASFQNQGDAYLVKPIDALTIDKTMQKLGFDKMDFRSSSIPNSMKGR